MGKKFEHNIISELESMWNISVRKTLSGSSHALVAYADGQNEEQKALEAADGCGYAKLYAYDLKKSAYLLERLGKPLNQLEYSVFEQLRIICSELQKTWQISATTVGLSNVNVAWFRKFIGETWEKLKHPCSHKVIEQSFSYLQSREEAANPEEFVLLHGDAHAGNTLKELSGDDFKLINPYGIIYEKAYDLGVLMREWIDEYQQAPLKKGKERCRYLCR